MEEKIEDKSFKEPRSIVSGIIVHDSIGSLISIFGRKDKRFNEPRSIVSDIIVHDSIGLLIYIFARKDKR